MTYAQGTTVSVERTQLEIRKTLAKYEATGFAFGEHGRVALVMFEIRSRRIKFVLPLPDPSAEEFVKVRKNSWSDAPIAVQRDRYNQAVRSRWRALSLAIKAKLEAVESGITTLEQEFLAHMVLPTGATVGQIAIPQLEKSLRDGSMPPLLGFDG